MKATRGEEFIKEEKVINVLLDQAELTLDNTFDKKR
jgi:hypothetical protein